MAKFRTIFRPSANESTTLIGNYDSIEKAAREAYTWANENGYTRSNCENRNSVEEALIKRQYCMLGYGPYELEIEEV